MRRLLAKTADAVAGSLADHCSAAPDGDWGECCRMHDAAYEFGSRWRLDRWLAANVALGWCVASQPSDRTATAIGRGLLGLVYALATSTVGIGWWLASKPVARPVKRWAQKRMVEIQVREAVKRADRLILHKGKGQTW